MSTLIRLGLVSDAVELTTLREQDILHYIPLQLQEGVGVRVLP